MQAEDGIRDAQESRGLGDVYKRQINNNDDLSKFDKGDVMRVKELIDAAKEKEDVPTFKVAE